MVLDGEKTLLVIIAHILVVKSLCDDTDELVSDVVGEEVAEVQTEA